MILRQYSLVLCIFVLPDKFQFFYASRFVTQGNWGQKGNKKVQVLLTEDNLKLSMWLSYFPRDSFSRHGNEVRKRSPISFSKALFELLYKYSLNEFDR